MEEKYNKVAKIANISPKVLESILNFAYTGLVTVAEDNIWELLDAAEFTQIPGMCIAPQLVGAVVP